MSDLIFNAQLPIVGENGVPTPIFAAWMTLVSQLSPLIGDGSPENSVAASRGRFYWDQVGNQLYFKEQAAIADDETRGWVAV